MDCFLKKTEGTWEHFKRKSFDCNPIKTFFQIAECESPLGLQSGDIPDSDITASSEVRNLTKLEAFNFSERVLFLQLRDTEKDIYWSNHRRLVTRNFITWLLHIISKQGLCFHSSFFNSKCFQIFTAKCLKHFFLFDNQLTYFISFIMYLNAVWLYN